MVSLGANIFPLDDLLCNLLSIIIFFSLSKDIPFISEKKKFPGTLTTITIPIIPTEFLTNIKILNNKDLLINIDTLEKY
ncbi:hypothetical protein CH372_18415 [Leptospira meyeri]|nr:hypothetical protein CH372_18415 [Leptospira meyeri]PKA23009.1 hypothetical protein CH381_27935 [Leptospira sp. mixed culture ATI2-C-A1]